MTSPPAATKSACARARIAFERRGLREENRANFHAVLTQLARGHEAVAAVVALARDDQRAGGNAARYFSIAARATASPALVISEYDATPYLSWLSRSSSRLCAAVRSFMVFSDATKPASALHSLITYHG